MAEKFDLVMGAMRSQAVTDRAFGTSADNFNVASADLRRKPAARPDGLKIAEVGKRQGELLWTDGYGLHLDLHDWKAEGHQARTANRSVTPPRASFLQP